MKQIISLILLGCFLLALCGCSSVDTKYNKLIAAIEADDYSQALSELQILMNIPATDPKPDDSPGVIGGEQCLHQGTDATCTEASVCGKCGTELAPAQGHVYENGVCTRCGSEDPADKEKKQAYQTLMNRIKEYERLGSIYSIPGVGDLKGSDAVSYIYQELTKLGDYRDCAEYLSRISIVPNKLLYIKLSEKDNLGNSQKNTTIDYIYDAQGRVTMSEDIRFNEQFGVYLVDTFTHMLSESYASGGAQIYTEVTYGDDERITEIKCYYVSLRAVITPAYDDKGRIYSAQYRLNTDKGTLSFTYDDSGRLIRIASSFPAELTYQYDAEGKLLSKNNRQYIYDAQGHLTGWKDGSNSCTVKNDSQGRILQEQVVHREGKTVYDYHYGDYYIYQPANTEQPIR